MLQALAQQTKESFEIDDQICLFKEYEHENFEDEFQIPQNTQLLN